MAVIACAKCQHGVSTHILDRFLPTEHSQTGVTEGIECRMGISMYLDLFEITTSDS